MDWETYILNSEALFSILVSRYSVRLFHGFTFAEQMGNFIMLTGFWNSVKVSMPNLY